RTDESRFMLFTHIGIGLRPDREPYGASFDLVIEGVKAERDTDNSGFTGRHRYLLRTFPGQAFRATEREAVSIDGLAHITHLHAIAVFHLAIAGYAIEARTV